MPNKSVVEDVTNEVLEKWRKLAEDRSVSLNDLLNVAFEEYSKPALADYFTTTSKRTRQVAATIYTKQKSAVATIAETHGVSAKLCATAIVALELNNSDEDDVELLPVPQQGAVPKGEKASRKALSKQFAKIYLTLTDAEYEQLEECAHSLRSSKSTVAGSLIARHLNVS